MQGKIQARGGSIADKLSNTIVGRGLGPGRYHVPHEIEGMGEGIGERAWVRARAWPNVPGKTTL